MGPHVPRRRFSFARRECGVRFSKVPLFGGACSKVGEEALQATWKDSISFASTIKVRSPNGLKALRYERRDCRFDPCPNHYGPVGQRFKPSHFLCEDPSSNLGGTTTLSSSISIWLDSRSDKAEVPDSSSGVRTNYGSIAKVVTAAD